MKLREVNKHWINLGFISDNEKIIIIIIGS